MLWCTLKQGASQPDRVVGRKCAQVIFDVSKGRATLYLLSMGLVLLVLRILALGDEAAWGDEALTTVCFPNEGFAGYLRCVFAEDGIPRLAPLYYGVQYGWSVLFGGDLRSLRLLSVFLNLVAFVQLFVLVASIANRRAARWATFFFAVSLFEIYYGQEVRFYALMNVFALLALQGAWYYSHGKRGLGLGLALLGNGGLVWTHAFGVVFVLSLGFYMLRFVRKPRLFLPWMGAHSLLAVALLGWVVWLGYDVDTQGTAYGDLPAGWRELLSTYVQFAGGRFSNMNPAEFLPLGFSADLIIAAFMASFVLIAVYTIGTMARKPETHDALWGGVLLLIVLSVPVLMLFLLGKLWRPCFFTRYVIYAALPFYALAGIGVAQCVHRRLGQAAAVLLVALFTWQNLALPRPFRADYGSVARAVTSEEGQEKTILALKPFNYDAVAYAVRDLPVTTELLYGLKETVGIGAQRVAEGKSVWVVFYRWDDLAGFEAGVEAVGLAYRRTETAGMPPLQIYHLYDAKADLIRPTAAAAILSPNIVDRPTVPRDPAMGVRE